MKKFKELVEELVGVDLKKKSFPADPDDPNPEANHYFDIHSGGRHVGSVHVYHPPGETEAHIQHIEIEPEWQKKVTLHKGLKAGLKKHFPNVDTYTGQRITGKHQGIHVWKVKK